MIGLQHENAEVYCKKLIKPGERARLSSPHRETDVVLKGCLF